MDSVLGQQQQMYNPYGSVPTLPVGWVEHRTPTGQPYWFNTMTGQSSWVYPMALAPTPKKKKQIKKKIPGTHWLFVLTHDGYEFYYDRETKKSIWEMPEELKVPMEELKKLEEQQKKEKEEEDAKKKKEEEEAKKAEEDRKRALEEEEQQLEAKRIKLEGEIVNKTAEENPNKEQELDATEMTEEDIMWQLQQMEGSDAGEYDEQDIEHQLQQQEQEDQQQDEEKIKEEPEVEKKVEMSEEECIAKFNDLLQERNISPFAIYSTEYPQLMTDPRFSLVPPNKQKSLFNKYCHALGEKVKNEKSKNNKKPEDEFRDLLESKVTKKMYWDDFRRKFKDDPRFKALSVTKEKEALFKEHIKHNLNRKRNPVDDYMNLLKDTKEIAKGMRWRDAKKLLENDDRYYAIEDKDKREDLFRDYLDEL